VDAGAYPLTIESTTDKGVSLFGTYQGETVTGKHLIEKASDYVLAEKKGDTLFLKLKELPYQRFAGVQNDPDVVLLIPSNVQLELKGSDRNLSVKPRNLKENWTIDSSGSVQMDVNEKEDVKIEASNVNELGGKGWKDIKKVNPEEEYSLQSGNLTIGKGTNKITIYHANTVEVH